MLNYAYGVLENRVRAQVLAAGFDPTIGLLHGHRRTKQGFVYDLMEPLRPLIDQRILEFIQDNEFSADDFIITASGTCRLNTELARLVTSHALQRVDELRERPPTITDLSRFAQRVDLLRPGAKQAARNQESPSSCDE